MAIKMLENCRGRKTNNRQPYIQTTNTTMPGKEGFSLRFVVTFVKRVRQFESAIRIRKNGVLADGKNIMEILILETAWKSTLYFECEGSDAEQAVRYIDTFFFSSRNMN